MRARPEAAQSLVGPLRRFEGAIERHAELFLEMSNSPDPTSRRAAVSAFGSCLQDLLSDEAAGQPTQIHWQVARRPREMAANDPEERVRDAAGWLNDEFARRYPDPLEPPVSPGLDSSWPPH